MLLPGVERGVQFAVDQGPVPIDIQVGGRPAVTVIEKPQVVGLPRRGRNRLVGGDITTNSSQGKEVVAAVCRDTIKATRGNKVAAGPARGRRGEGRVGLET